MIHSKIFLSGRLTTRSRVREVGSNHQGNEFTRPSHGPALENRNSESGC